MVWILLIVFLLLTLLFLTGRGSSLLIGFNSLSKEEQAQYRVKSICHDFGVFVLLPFDAVWLLSYFFKKDILIAAAVLLYIIYLAVCAVLWDKRGGLRYYRRDTARKAPPSRPDQP